MECACRTCQTLREYLHAMTSKHKKLRSLNTQKPLRDQLCCSCMQCGQVGTPGQSLDASLKDAMDSLISPRKSHPELMPGVRSGSVEVESGMHFRNPLAATGFDVAPTFPECKLMRAHFEEADVEFREYQPMTSLNKRWSKDELMPQIVRALYVFAALDHSAIRTSQ